MLELRGWKKLLASLLALALAGCGLGDRTGPTPVLDATVATEASNNKALLLNALVSDAGYGEARRTIMR